MAVSVKTSGSQTAVIDTEHTLATVADAGVYALVVDTAAMAEGDVLTLRLYSKARSTDTERLVFSGSYAHAQRTPLKISIAIPSPHHLKATLLQEDGTGRAFPWAIWQV